MLMVADREAKPGKEKSLSRKRAQTGNSQTRKQFG